MEAHFFSILYCEYISQTHLRKERNETV
jgi:hypothetical protein